MTLNPTIKSCRFVQEHILRFWRNKYFGRNNTFSFWSLNTSKAPASSAPFYSSGSFETWWAHTSSISFCSTRAYSSHFTFYSLNPCAPVGPCVPLMPLVPLGPKIPRGPVFPGAPFSPLYPGYPGAPFSPLGPSWPLWQSLSALEHACVNFLSISWRICCKDNTPGVGAIFRLSRGCCLETLSRVSWNSVDNKNRLLLVRNRWGR